MRVSDSARTGSLQAVQDEENVSKQGAQQVFTATFEGHTGKQK